MGGPTAAVPFLSHSLGDPNKVYDHPPGLQGSYSTFKLQHFDGKLLGEEELKEAWKYATTFLDQEKENFLGFQANLAGNYSQRPELTHFLDSSLNNIGDPFANGSFSVNSKFLERPVLDYFASLWNAKWPYEKEVEDRYWGFVLSMGGTEGNLYGMWNGRDYLAGKVLLIETPKQAGAREARGSFKVPAPRYVYAESAERSMRDEKVLCFFSKATHYSLKKAMVVLNITTFYDEAMAYYRDECPLEPPASDLQWQADGWPSEVPTNQDGSMDIDALEAFVKFFAEKTKSKARNYSFLFCFNYGTVFKGAYDDVERAGKSLIPIFQDCGLFERTLTYRNRDGEPESIKRNGWWFHVDGALGAAYMPFLQLARERGIEVPEDDPSRSYKFDFGLNIEIPPSDPTNPDPQEYPLVHSISMSGHKWIGAPVPTGIFMTKVKYQLQPPQKDAVTYIGSLDTTFAGSRSGLAPAFLWTYFSQRSYDSLIEKAIDTQKTAIYFVDALKGLEKLKAEEGKPIDLSISRAKLSLAIVFKRPKPDICLKYSLSKEEEVLLDGDGKPIINQQGKAKINYVVHAYAMEHVRNDVIDELIKDCTADDAFAYEWSRAGTLVPAEELSGW